MAQNIRSGAWYVGLGILSSKLLGLLRTKLMAHFLGTGVAAAALNTAIKLPNILQNLLGDSALSASFVPEYASLRAKGRHEDADRLAGTVFALLSVLMSVLAVLGVVATPWLVSVIARGLTSETQQLCIRMVRVLFPGTAVVVLAAWSLAILASHRRFFWGYAAPVVWNLAQIAVLLIWGFSHSSEQELGLKVAWAASIGFVLQFLVQLPLCLRLLGKFRPSLDVSFPPARQVFRKLVPNIMSRGVVQLSASIDLYYVNFLGERAASALGYAQTMAFLPISLFGMSISAAELPALSEDAADQNAEDPYALLKNRLNAAYARLVFYVIPCAVALLFLGDVWAAALYQGGKFGVADSRYVGYILMGSAVGLVAQGSGRLFSSAFFALKDTTTPFYASTVRVVLTIAWAWFSVTHLTQWLNLPLELGAVGMAVGTGWCAWLEMGILRGVLERRIGRLENAEAKVSILWSCSVGAAGMVLILKYWAALHFGVRLGLESTWMGHVLPIPNLHPWLSAIVAAGAMLILYATSTWLLQVSEARNLVTRVFRPLKKMWR